MKSLSIYLLLISSLVVHANEALDVLEGRIDARSVVLPPRPYVAEDSADGEKVENIVYLEPEWAASPPDLLWARSVLYDNSANPWVQHLAVMGYFDFRSSFGKVDTDPSGVTPARNTDMDGTRTRRARLGARIRTFNRTEIEAVGEFAGDSEYQGIERLKAYTQVSDTTGVTIGKFRPNLGAESRVEEQLSPYPQRAMLFNMISPAPSLGVSFHHAGETLDYDLGWFSSDFSPDIPSLGGAGLMNLSVSRTFYEKNGDSVSRNRWHLDYLHNFDAGRSNPSGYSVVGRNAANGNQLVVSNPAYRHLFSVGLTIESEKFAFLGDFQLAKGDTTVWGMNAGASYWAIPGTLKLVGRYQYAGSDDPQAIVSSLGNAGDLRYDGSPFFVGDEYHSFYLGANLHLYKDDLVIRNGVEYSIINDDVGNAFNTEALIWQSGASLSF